MMITAFLKSILNMHFPFDFLIKKKQENISFSFHQREEFHDMFKGKKL